MIATKCFKVLLSNMMFFCFLINSSGATEITAKNILDGIDKNMSLGKDMNAIMDMTLIDKNGGTSKRIMKFYRKTISQGVEKKIFTFKKPADVAGVTFLSLSDDEMYTYMPAFQKIRRIASHVKNEKFMGTDMSYNDMSESEYSTKFSPMEKYKTEGEHYILTLIPIKGADTDYSKLIVTARKDNSIRVKVEMYGSNGKLEKVMTQTNIEKVNDYWTPKTITMEDVANKHKTIMEMKDIAYDTNLQGKLFKKRYMRRIK